MRFHRHVPLLVLVAILGQDVAFADPVPVVVVTDTAAWLANLKELRTVLPRRNDAFADPVARCADPGVLASRTGPADRVGIAFVAGARLVHAAEGPFQDVAPKRLAAVRPLVEALDLSLRNDENDAERDAMEALDALQGHLDAIGFARFVNTVRARLEDRSLEEGEAFTAGMIVARMFASLELGDDNGRLDALTHARSWILLGADAPKPLRELFAVLVQLAAAPDVDAGRLNEAVGAACSSLRVD